jgi:hypothetical protein
MLEFLDFKPVRPIVENGPVSIGTSKEVSFSFFLDVEMERMSVG